MAEPTRRASRVGLVVRLGVVGLVTLMVGLIPATARADVDLFAGRWNIGNGAAMDVVLTGDHEYTGTLAVVGTLCPPVGRFLIQVSGSGTHFEGTVTAYNAAVGCDSPAPDDGIVIDLNNTGTLATVAFTPAPGYPCDNCASVTWTRLGAPPTDDALPWWPFVVAALLLILLAALLTTVARRARRRRQPTHAAPPPVPAVLVGFHPRPGPPTPPSVHTGPTPGLRVGLTARLERGQLTVSEKAP